MTPRSTRHHRGGLLRVHLLYAGRGERGGTLQMTPFSTCCQRGELLLSRRDARRVGQGTYEGGTAARTLRINC